ncbi:CLAVATA3/ESR (CLE)-related protein 5-like [Hevea brasiliensis]|uniref:CLAVATA3/ESR (CLE)-related protein 5-like n=1 Tax=Hevea brasiliensis TaxID=3981 RepID=UPI0025E6ABE1|nr:CLAVATA3/ESR (CLE)-related protein 5-like [Hevea brasiliensis]
MANNTITLKGLVAFLMIFSALLWSSQAVRILKEEVEQANQKNNRLLLHELLGFDDLSKFKRHQKSLSSTLRLGGDRVSPGGPDPQHH